MPITTLITNLTAYTVTLNATVTNWVPKPNDTYEINITAPNRISGTINNTTPSLLFTFSQTFASLSPGIQYTWEVRITAPTASTPAGQGPDLILSGNTFTTLPPSIPNYPPPQAIEDISGCQSKIGVDIAELYSKVNAPTVEDEDAHIINIVTKQPLTIERFKQMFYHSGDGSFSIANCYTNPRSTFNIYKSDWGVTDPSNLFLYNYNRLGGRDNNPPATFLAYAYESDRYKSFAAQVDVISNMERDLCHGRKEWTFCSRASIFDAMYNLTFAREKFSSPCLETQCARSWDEMEDALNEELLCKNLSLSVGDYIDFFINVRIDNCNECIKPTIIRIRFITKITNGWVDFQNWAALSQFFDSSSNVPFGNLPPVLTEVSTPVFVNCEFRWNKGSTDLSGNTGVPNWMWWLSNFNNYVKTGGGFLIFDSQNFPYVTQSFINSSVDTLVLSSIQPNGIQAPYQWPSYYFKTGHEYMIERSINGYPNNYMKFRTSSDISDLMDSSSIQIGLLNDITWLAGSGTYQLGDSDNLYCLNIYDLSQHNCIGVPGIPYDSPEGGSAQWANASQTETQANAQNQQQTQLPTSTAPANSNNSTDPHDGVPLTDMNARFGYNVIIKAPPNPSNIFILFSAFPTPPNPDITVKWISDPAQDAGSTAIFNYEIEFRNSLSVIWESWNQKQAAAGATPDPYAVPSPLQQVLTKAVCGFVGGETYQFRITAQSFSGNSATITPLIFLTYPP